MLSYNTLLELIKQSVENTPSLLSIPIGLSFETAISEFAHVGFRLPRQSGKSTVARELHHNTSSLLYTRYGPNGFNLYNEEVKFRGRRFYGMKLEYIILDEFSTIPLELVYFIYSILLPAGLIHKNFRIVSLYT